ncbi:MAG: ImmA/IrrE family metallo-endopeptidase [Alicyclobacillus sp.]|nr:ImmA/IrrE family metallo-endopeptidase [Alicyclobacillus sp.]
MTRVAVNPDILRWAMRRADESVASLSKKFPKIAQWLDGTTLPTLRQLEEFAKSTHVPLGSLFLRQPPDESLPIPYFRTGEGDVPRRPSAELLDTIRQMKLRQNWMHEYLQRMDASPLDFVGSHSIEEDTQSIVHHMREVLMMDDQWAKSVRTWEEALRQLRYRMEDIGVLVVVNSVVGNNTHRKLDLNEFRGFVLIDSFAPLVFVNGKDSKAAQMFTLAHELAHVFLGKGAIFDLLDMMPAHNKLEMKCNEVAAEFLVPKHHLLSQWDKHVEFTSEITRLARQYKVSELVVARRALDLGLMSKDEFFHFYSEYQNRILNIQERDEDTESGGDFYSTTNLRVGRRFARAVVTAVLEGEVSYTEAYQLTGLSGTTFDKYVEWLEGVRQ